MSGPAKLNFYFNHSKRMRAKRAFPRASRTYYETQVYIKSKQFYFKRVRSDLFAKVCNLCIKKLTKFHSCSQSASMGESKYIKVDFPMAEKPYRVRK